MKLYKVDVRDDDTIRYNAIITVSLAEKWSSHSGASTNDRLRYIQLAKTMRKRISLHQNKDWHVDGVSLDLTVKSDSEIKV